MESFYKDRTLPIQYIGKAQADLYKIRGDVYKFMVMESERATAKTDIAIGIAYVEVQMKLYTDTFLVQAEKDEIAKFTPAWTAYKTAIANIITNIETGNNHLSIKVFWQVAKLQTPVMPPLIRWKA